MMKKINRNKIIIICIAAGVILSLTSVTLAYLGTLKNKENRITVGHDDVSITEDFSSPEKMEMRNYTTKEIKVTNTGNVPCYVRVFAEFSDSKVAAGASVMTENFEYKSWADFKDELADATNTISENWRYVKSTGTDDKIGGYFYYTKKLPVGASTEAPLIRGVKTDFSSGTDNNIDRIKDFDIIVYSETVQTTELGGEEFEDNEKPAWRQAWESFLKV